MKKLILCIIISFCVLSVKEAQADQLAYLSVYDAERVVDFFEEFKIKELILFCGCCEGDTPKKVTIDNVYLRHTGYEEYYEVIIEGLDEDGNIVNQGIDLAYAHLKRGTKTITICEIMDMECDPCTPPLFWNSKKSCH